MKENDEFEEIKFETVSHQCAQAISEARLANNLTQAKLAAATGLKTSTIVDIENSTARYDATEINCIEKALNVKIPRGRKNRKKR